MNLLACSASVAYSPAQANCLSLGEINSSQLVYLSHAQSKVYYLVTSKYLQRCLTLQLMDGDPNHYNIFGPIKCCYSFFALNGL